MLVYYYLNNFMRKLLVLLTLILSFISVSISSYADQSQDELLKKEKLIQEKMVGIRDVTMCQVLYYNFALYFVITDTITKDFQIDEEKRKPFMQMYDSSKNKYLQFKEISKQLMFEVAELGVPLPIIQQTEMIGQRMALDSISSLTATMFNDPTYGDKFFDTLLELSNLCDNNRK